MSNSEQPYSFANTRPRMATILAFRTIAKKTTIENRQTSLSTDWLALCVLLCFYLAYVLYLLFMSVCLSPTVSVDMGLFNLK